MKFLIDADCHRSIGSALKKDGHQVSDIRDLIPHCPDETIYKLLQKESYILITRDLDFSNILRYPASSNCGIILLRVHLLPVEGIIYLIRDLLSRVTLPELLGSITVIRKDRYRIHKISI